MASVLIIDDDPMIMDILYRHLDRMGFYAGTADTLKSGLELAKRHEWDLVFLDVSMPDGNGLEMIPYFQKTPGSPEVIIFTGRGEAEGAEMAIKSGAWDYLQKGCSIKDLTLSLTRALSFREEKRTLPPPLALNRPGIIGSSPIIQQCLNQLAQAAAGDGNVLVTGPTGCGKELFSRAIHENSNRSSESFVVVDCAAIPENLMENILFGHERGAYTGADRATTGLVYQADKGTLFLDEIGELPLTMQKSLLRVLEQRSFRPVGSDRELKSDFRLIAATNRNLKKMAEEGDFRLDLLYRVSAINLTIPGLAEHREDIKELVMFHLGRLCDRYGIEHKGFSSNFISLLKEYHWPGNVRELINALEYAISQSGGQPTLFHLHLPEEIRIAVAKSTLSTENEDQSETGRAMPTLQAYMKTEEANLERGYLKRLMETTQWDIKKAMRISGMGRSTIYKKLQKHGIARTWAP